MQLREVPSDILSLQQLRILDLSQNSLQSVPVVTYFLIKTKICINFIALNLRLVETHGFYDNEYELSFFFFFFLFQRIETI